MSGLKMQRELTIFACFWRMADGRWEPKPIYDQMIFQEATFATSLDKIAESLLIYSANVPARERLPSWED